MPAGMARLSMDVMKALGLVSGDIIEIEGKKKATAVVWPGYPEDTRKSILRIDGNIRSTAATGIDEKVRIRKIEVSYAKKVVIQPTQPIRLVGGEQYLLRLLRGRSVQEGQAIRVDVLGNPLTFRHCQGSAQRSGVSFPTTRKSSCGKRHTSPRREKGKRDR